jgi:hypothetical protein
MMLTRVDGGSRCLESGRQRWVGAEPSLAEGQRTHGDVQTEKDCTEASRNMGTSTKDDWSSAVGAEGWDGVTLRTLRGGAVAQIVEGGLGRSSEVVCIEERQGSGRRGERAGRPAERESEGGRRSGVGTELD